MAALIIFLPFPALSHDSWVIDQDNVPKVWRLVPGRGWASGAGIVVAPLVILTARHVVNSKEDKVEVSFETGGRLEAKAWCLSSPSRDFAIISMAVPNPAHSDHLLRINPSPLKQGDVVTIVGWPVGGWSVLQATVLYETEDNPIIGDGEPIKMQNITWVGPVGPYAERRGFSGGPVFDSDGALRGLICCVNLLTGFVGYVPIKYGLSECPLIPARRIGGTA